MIFHDESREIASEYNGGLGRYGIVEISPPVQVSQEDPFDFSVGGGMQVTAVSQAALPPIQPLLPPSFSENIPQPVQDPVHDGQPIQQQQHQHQSQQSVSDSGSYPAHQLVPPQIALYRSPAPAMATSDDSRGALTIPDEVMYMQVFVEEVGLWMDTYDPMKHVCPSPLQAPLSLSLFSSSPC